MLLWEILDKVSRIRMANPYFGPVGVVAHQDIYRR